MPAVPNSPSSGHTGRQRTGLRINRAIPPTASSRQRLLSEMTSVFESTSFPLQDLLGISVEVVAPGRARATAEADAATLNPNGVVHGSVLFAMADTAMAAATMSVIGDDMACASIEVHMRFLRPILKDSIHAEAVVLRAGQRIVQLEVRVSNASGEPVALATGSFGVCPKRPSGQGRAET